jgi:YfiH family protein
MTLALRSGLLEQAGFRHAFFTRLGGVSQPPWKSLNFSATTGDDADAVAENFARAARELGLERERIYHLSQVHGCSHRVLAGREDRREVAEQQGDITVALDPGVGCGVRTADCAPVLLGAPRAGAVAAVHSGWRGTVAGAVQAGVRALRSLLPHDEPLLAAIGPHIERCCFEVGPEVADQIAAACGLERESVVDRSRPRPHVDLRAVIDAQLREEGVDRVDHVTGCTMCDVERFHTYRRDGPISGRMLAVIVSGVVPSPPQGG